MNAASHRHFKEAFSAFVENAFMPLLYALNFILRIYLF